MDFFMNYKIVADSCCDMNPELREKWNLVSVPLIMTLGDKCFTDNENLDLEQYMQEMKECKSKIGSAAPAPALYKDAFEGEHTSFGITLSSRLSGSYGSAMAGKAMAEEEGKADVHVFDSKSASAGEILIALKIRKLIEAGKHKLEIIPTVEKFINEMKTYFVIDNIDNLLKNGRLNKITGKIISMLGIKPIMGADKDGNIALFSQARGIGKVIDKLAGMIESSGKNTEGESMVITHCNNKSLAERLKDTIKERYRFKEILVLPTKGLSSMYVNDQGVIMSF